VVAAGVVALVAVAVASATIPAATE